MALKIGLGDQYFDFQFNEADLIGNIGLDMIAPADGYITEFATTVHKAITTGGTLQIKTGDTSAVTVAGLTQTIASASAKGVRQRTTATQGSSTRWVTKGTRIVVQPASFATAGQINGYLKFSAAQNDVAAGF